MEGTKLLKVKERMSALGYFRSYENDFYKVSFLYAGDVPEEEEKEGYQYDPFLTMISTRRKNVSLPDLLAEPGDGKIREPYAGLEIWGNIYLQDFDLFSENLQIAKETLWEIDRVMREAYPNLGIIKK